jgi:hypothetical protein
VSFLLFSPKYSNSQTGFRLRSGFSPADGGVPGVMLCNGCFVVAALLLWRLSSAALRDERLATLSVLLFCCSPANVFFSAIYTESPFAMFRFRCFFAILLCLSFRLFVFFHVLRCKVYVALFFLFSQSSSSRIYV